MQRKAVELLEKQLQLQADDEDQRIARAIREREEVFLREEAAKKEKQERGIREILEHLKVVLKEKAIAKTEEEKQAVEDLKRRIADAEALVKEEAEKRAKQRAICKELADDWLQKAVRALVRCDAVKLACVPHWDYSRFPISYKVVDSLKKM
ncbi:unnamed protein product [Dibothriocephalus latus]|uniref:Trichohyalin-plectin-homology domain-containing protein n=1 Tax=Dibothriocephalus latus TaxID=60516 RepID=A0A3P7NL80_DIBLA|nr:unnamed protein product [Dibothriocephalus latus]